jgi:hypothetical protein
MSGSLKTPLLGEGQFKSEEPVPVASKTSQVVPYTPHSAAKVDEKQRLLPAPYQVRPSQIRAGKERQADTRYCTSWLGIVFIDVLLLLLLDPGTARQGSLRGAEIVADARVLVDDCVRVGATTNQQLSCHCNSKRAFGGAAPCRRNPLRRQK